MTPRERVFPGPYWFHLSAGMSSRTQLMTPGRVSWTLERMTPLRPHLKQNLVLGSGQFECLCPPLRQFQHSGDWGSKTVAIGGSGGFTKELVYARPGLPGVTGRGFIKGGGSLLDDGIGAVVRFRGVRSAERYNSSKGPSYALYSHD